MNILVKLAWKNLFRNMRRTMASLITVALGAAGLLIYQGFNSGIMNQYRENVIHGYYGNGQVFPKNYYGHVLEKPWDAWIENPAEVEKQIKSLPLITEVFPRLSFYSFVVKGGINLGGHGEGILPERENSFFTEMNFISGESFKSEDEVILGKGLAESLNAKVGETVTVLTQTIHGQMNGADLKVTGIFHTGKKTIDDNFFRIHLHQAQLLLDTNRVELFSLATKGVHFWDQVEKDITTVNPNLEPIRFEILDKVYYQNSVDFLNAQFAFIRTIILIIVALGIFNTISVGLMERSGEIGALRANGETRKRLFSILILENSFLGFFGGLIGIIFAVTVNSLLLQKGIPMPPGPGITRHFLIYLEMSGEHYAQALLLPMITAILSSLWPIYKLFKKSIPDLLRTT